MFRFYTNAVSQASRQFAAGIFVLGLILIGVGFLIWVLRELFAILFAVLFCVAGVGCGIFAVRLFWAQRKLSKMGEGDSGGYRENVSIHIEEHYDV
jgi:cobalamin biosynthesis protein CobD/CbiB